jgi:hypothetical protein
MDYRNARNLGGCEAKVHMDRLEGLIIVQDYPGRSRIFISEQNSLDS